MAAPATNIPEAESLEQETSALAVQAEALKITDAASFERAGLFLRGVKAMRERVANTFDPIQTKAHAAWKEVLRQRKTIEEPMERAERIVKGSISTYTLEQERRARVEAARAAAAAKKADEERRLAEAASLEAAGEPEAAAAVLDEPAPPPPPPPAPVARVSGITTRTVWKARVTDKAALIRAVADGKAPSSLLEVDEASLGALARASKGELRIPGVEAFEERGVSARAF